jgi:RNA polymerase sigma factor (sigma-70 family)
MTHFFTAMAFKETTITINLPTRFKQRKNDAPTLPRITPPQSLPLPRTDAELVQACIARDESAWNELVARYGRLVYSIPRRYGLTPQEADDVFQNVFLIVLRHLRNLKNKDSLAAWLVTITHREAQNTGKRQRQHVELDETMADSAETHFEVVERDVLRYQVHQALERLDARTREFILAIMADDRPSYEEIAQRFGMAIGSVGPTRARCFKKLETILKEMGVEIY